MGRRDGGKEAQWRRHVRGQRASGLSVRGYCASHGLRESAFYWWKRIIGERDAEKAPAQALGRTEPLGRASFAEVVVRETPQASAEAEDQGIIAGLLVEFPCGARVRLGQGFDAAEFARVARALLAVERC